MTVLLPIAAPYFDRNCIAAPPTSMGSYEEIHRIALIALRSIFEQARNHQNYKEPVDLSYFMYPNQFDDASGDMLSLCQVCCRSKDGEVQKYFVAIAMSELNGCGRPAFKGLSHPCFGTGKGGLHPSSSFLRDPKTWYIWL